MVNSDGILAFIKSIRFHMNQLFSLKEINHWSKPWHDKHGHQPKCFIEEFGINHIKQEKKPEAGEEDKTQNCRESKTLKFQKIGFRSKPYELAGKKHNSHRNSEPFEKTYHGINIVKDLKISFL